MTRRSRSGIRHDDGPMPAEYSRTVEAGRWAVLGLLTVCGLALMVAHMLGVGL